MDSGGYPGGVEERNRKELREGELQQEFKKKELKKVLQMSYSVDGMCPSSQAMPTVIPTS